MNDLIQQLGALVLRSTPTMLLFLLVLLAYRLLVYAPLTKTLAERRRRTEGAMEEAARAIALAQDKTSEHEQKLLQARQTVYHAREERLRALQAETEMALAAARLAAQKQAAAAREAVEKEFEHAKVQINASIQQLGAAAIARVMSPASESSEVPL